MRCYSLHILTACALLFGSAPTACAQQKSADATPLAGTQALTMEGDLAAQMVDGIDRFLLRELAQSAAKRERYWQPDVSSPEGYEKSLAPLRDRLKHILGVRDARVKFTAPELVATVEHSGLVGKGDSYNIYAVRWPAVRGVYGEGLLLQPRSTEVKGHIIALPDADQTPEQICGLSDGVPRDSQFARRLAEAGCRVLVPTLVSRELKPRFPPERQNGARLTNREFLYRPAFELGRHLIGYELQKVFAGVDWFAGDKPADQTRIGVIGYGEGGMLALYAGAIDPRIDAVGVSGFFGQREKMWDEPIDRNVFGLLERFGGAELATMVLPRHLTVEDSVTPNVVLPSEGGAPARIVRPDRITDANPELARIEKLLPTLGGAPVTNRTLINGPVTSKELVSSEQVAQFLQGLNPQAFAPPRPTRNPPEPQRFTAPNGASPTWAGDRMDPGPRQQRQCDEIERDTQLLLAESAYVRQEFMKKLDTSSLEKYEQSVGWYRDFFANDVIGKFDLPLSPPQPRSRKAYDEAKWTGYEVVLDVFPDVYAYGLLLVPKDVKEGERRPVVVCQHGLEGRPQDVIGEQGKQHYDAFAAKLAERGFVTFAPQNIYIGKDRFRTLQRKANPLGKTLFSIMVPQHQQLVKWLGELPFVDKNRIAFYGLSYGGKSAMRIPPLVPEYSAVICSADFNEWVWKNASTRAPYSYVWTNEYEIFEFDLGSTFNYAEMAALICPRPFMVERGHYDGVSSDEAVLYEYAKVQFLYQGRLKLPGRCEIEVFDGPHKINSMKTYDFLHRHLQWPKRE
jgi:dienelactone hydrolase